MFLGFLTRGLGKPPDGPLGLSLGPPGAYGGFERSRPGCTFSFFIVFNVRNTPGYLKAVWPDFWGAFSKSGWARGPGKASKSVGDFAPHIFEGFPGAPGQARPQKRTQTLAH